MMLLSEDLQEHNIQVVPAFSGGLDARPAIEKYFKNSEKTVIDGLLSLTGFSLVGGPCL
jgi:magnesium chelatase subunit H